MCGVSFVSVVCYISVIGVIGVVGTIFGGWFFYLSVGPRTWINTSKGQQTSF